MVLPFMCQLFINVWLCGLLHISKWSIHLSPYYILLYYNQNVHLTKYEPVSKLEQTWEKSRTRGHWLRKFCGNWAPLVTKTEFPVSGNISLGNLSAEGFQLISCLPLISPIMIYHRLGSNIESSLAGFVSDTVKTILEIRLCLQFDSCHDCKFNC